MPTLRFLSPYLAGDDGIVAIGGAFSTENLLSAYRRGIFPWPTGDGATLWVCPTERAIIEFNELHVPRSLRKERERTRCTFTIDRDFRSVITACATADRGDQPGTWITDEMLEAYCGFHQAGYAHSVEVWEEEELVGGLYGVEVDGVFAGESMFHRRPNASKFALLYLIDHLKAQGAQWIDIQVLTPHMEVLGAREISRSSFLQKLAATRRPGLSNFHTI